MQAKNSCLRGRERTHWLVSQIYSILISAPNLWANSTILTSICPHVYTAKKQTKKNQASDLLYKCSQKMKSQLWGWNYTGRAATPPKAKEDAGLSPRLKWFHWG
jgi:hypothetical protein